VTSGCRAFRREADALSGLLGWFHQLPDRFKDNLEVGIVLVLQFIESLLEVAVIDPHLSQANSVDRRFCGRVSSVPALASLRSSSVVTNLRSPYYFRISPSRHKTRTRKTLVRAGSG
jgi:hypothetical protein